MINERLLLECTQRLKSYSLAYYTIATLLKRSGGRISEILGIEKGDLIDTDLYMIRGKKGSNNYTVYCAELTHYISLFPSPDSLVFSTIHPSSVYRAFKKFGIVSLKKGRKHYSVTHTFRNLRAQKAREQFKNEEITKDLLHHKSKASQKHYL